MRCLLITLLCSLVLLSNGLSVATALSSSFSYQGRLLVAGIPASGTYDLQFILFDAPTAGNQVGPIVTNSQITISNGLFFTSLDFGNGVFNGTAYWLQIGVRTNGSTADYQALLTRNAILTTPYATFAATVPSTGIQGIVPDALLSSNLARLNVDSTFTAAVQFTNPTNLFLGAFSGDGTGLSNLSAMNLVGRINTTNPVVRGVVDYSTDISSVTEQVATNFDYPTGPPAGYVWRSLVPTNDVAGQVHWCAVRRSAVLLNSPWVQPIPPTGGSTLTSTEFVFGTDASSFIVLLRGSGSYLGIGVDGADDWSRLYTSPDARTHYYTVTFDSSARRQITLKLSSDYQFGGIFLPTTNGIWPGLLPAQKRLIVVGDSFSEDTASAGWTSCLISLFRNVDVWSSAVGSTGYINPGTSGRVNFQTRIIPDVVSNSPDYVVFAGGINDNSATTNSAAAAALQAACVACYQAVQTNLPNCRIVVLGPFWPGTPGPSSIFLVNNAISNACQTVGIRSNYVDTLSDPWVTGVWNQPGSGSAVNYTLSDGTHPTSAGAWNIAYHVASELARRFSELNPREKVR